MNWLTALFQVLHVGGAIIAFGPVFTFALIGGMGGNEPAHSNFALRLADRIEMRLVLPLALFEAVTGIGIIWTDGIDVFAHLWLLIGIVLYVIAMTIVFVNQLPVMRKLVEATSAPPPPPAPGSPPPAGPPPHIAALIRRNQLGGMILMVLLLVIIVLMVLGTNDYLG